MISTDSTWSSAYSNYTTGTFLWEEYARYSGDYNYPEFTDAEIRAEAKWARQVEASRVAATFLPHQHSTRPATRGRARSHEADAALWVRNLARRTA